MIYYNLSFYLPRLRVFFFFFLFFRPICYWLNDLILVIFNGNTLFNIPYALFKLVVCLPIALLKFLFFVIKIISNFVGKILVILRNFYLFF